MREIVDEETCHYEYEPPKEGEAAGSAAPPGKPSEEAEGEAMAKTMASGFAEGPPFIGVKIYWEDGNTTVMATRMANQLLGAEMKNAFEPLAGIGDEAWLGPMASILVFSKGDVGVELDLRLLPNARDKGIRLAQLIAGRIP